MSRFLQRVYHFLILAPATGGFISYPPVWIFPKSRYTGAGILGTFWGVLLLKRLPQDTGPQLFTWALAFAASVIISDLAEKITQVHDDPRIIIDEFIGYWTAMLFMPRSLAAVAVAFVLFRLFDTWKPLGIRRAGELPGGWGIVLDDIAAGVAANLLGHLLLFIIPF